MIAFPEVKDYFALMKFFNEMPIKMLGNIVERNSVSSNSEF